MAIFRGDGGAGDANNNVSINEIQQAKSDAEAAKVAAQTAETNAENWATQVDSLVDSTDYSSKEYAIGTTVPAGSAKDWAITAEDTLVNGSEYSAKHYAAKATTNGSTQVSYATEWATKAEDTLISTAAGGDGATDYSALHHAAKANASADEAENWAQKINGEAVTGEGYSSKAWATGGTGVTDTAGSGAAKEWAVEQSGTVDGTEYSAKEYAIGTQTAQSNGSAKQWAIGGGASFDRDTVVSGSEYSAKYWANQAANSVSTFDEKYYGTYSSDAAAETAHTNGGFTVSAGDLYYNDTDDKLKYYNGTSWNNIEAVDTSSFATAGFSIAMSIAL